ncbi:hypothetical protein TIFTF001_027780 [Ficus carica]|uniref:Uncharacterized protein n=1 Tax=Ficus carica TaxID=3494 RepID=A0AA88DNN2_FICCA|nr:hypothetical protein TIFTF001_027780 [Ficus carica]
MGSRSGFRFWIEVVVGFQDHDRDRVLGTGSESGFEIGVDVGFKIDVSVGIIF